MTPNEIFRTAHEYVNKTTDAGYSFGDGLPHGINQVCRYCKSCKTTELTKNHPDYTAFKDFYKTYNYKAYQCDVCSALFSWYRKA